MITISNLTVNSFIELVNWKNFYNGVFVIPLIFIIIFTFSSFICLYIINDLKCKNEQEKENGFKELKQGYHVYILTYFFAFLILLMLQASYGDLFSKVDISFNMFGLSVNGLTVMRTMLAVFAISGLVKVVNILKGNYVKQTIKRNVITTIFPLIFMFLYCVLLNVFNNSVASQTGISQTETVNEKILQGFDLGKYNKIVKAEAIKEIDDIFNKYKTANVEERIVYNKKILDLTDKFIEQENGGYKFDERKLSLTMYKDLIEKAVKKVERFNKDIELIDVFKKAKVINEDKGSKLEQVIN